MVRIAVTVHKVQYCLKLDYIFVAIGLTMNAKANINGDVVIKQFTMSHGWGYGIDTKLQRFLNLRYWSMGGET